MIGIGVRVRHAEHREFVGETVGAHAPGMRSVRWDDGSTSDVYVVELELESERPS